MELIIDPRVEIVFNNYPEIVRKKMLSLRSLIINTASEINEIENLEESLKWGEPSYLSKHGSTIRIDWKLETPEVYSMYFKCTSKLVPRFKEVFKDKFKFEKNRAIIFNLDEEIPETELKQCITLALTYHRIKHLHLLGA